MRFFGFIFLFISFLATPTLASEDSMYLVFQNGPNSVTIYTTPCVSEKVTQYIQPDSIKFFQRALVLYEHKEYQACWRLDPNDPDVVFIVDEDRDVGTVPVAAFKRPEMI